MRAHSTHAQHSTSSGVSSSASSNRNFGTAVDASGFFVDEPTRKEAACDDDDASDALYSQPIDIFGDFRPSGGARVVKSYSTNNFRTLGAPQGSAQLPTLRLSFHAAQDALHSRPISPRRFNLSKQSEFLVSSSSSSDEPGNSSSRQSSHEARVLFARRQDIRVETGVHYHNLLATNKTRAPRNIRQQAQQQQLICSAKADYNYKLQRQPIATSQVQESKQPHKSLFPHSVSLYDCKHISSTSGAHVGAAPPGVASASKLKPCDSNNSNNNSSTDFDSNSDLNLDSDSDSSYKLTQMLLEFGAGNKQVRDGKGRSALLLAVLSNNLAAIKCLLERGAKPHEPIELPANALSRQQRRPLGVKPSISQPQHVSAFDLAACDETLVDAFRLLVEHCSGADLSELRNNSPLLETLVEAHDIRADKSAQIQILLAAGCKICARVWRAAEHKLDVQVLLIDKLCADGYFLYKTGQLDAALFRFEYALQRVASVEQRVRQQHEVDKWLQQHFERLLQALRAAKYQSYLGLSRCERSRKVSGQRKSLTRNSAQQATNELSTDSCTHKSTSSAAWNSPASPF